MKAASFGRRRRARAPAKKRPPATSPAPCPVREAMARKAAIMLEPWAGQELAIRLRDFELRIEAHERSCATCRAVEGPLDRAF